MSFKSFIASGSAKMAMFVVGACILGNGIPIGVSCIISISNENRYQDITHTMDAIDSTDDLQTILNLGHQLRVKCLDNQDWREFDTDNDVRDSCRWAIGNDI